MPKTRIISPGISNHSLKKNLELDGNYISNDGGDEGITVANDGIVTMSSQLDIGNMSLTTSELDISSGDLTLDVAGDIKLDADGDNITFGFNSDPFYDFAPQQFKMYNTAANTVDYFQIYVENSNAKTRLKTNDASGGAGADLVFDADGDINFSSAANKEVKFLPTTKTDSSTSDSSLRIAETLNSDTGGSGEFTAGGSDVHYGLWYTQTQTDLAGWNSVYLMYLDGGTNKVLSVDSNGLITLPGTITIKEQSAAPNHVDTYGKLWVLNDDPTSLYFTNDDGHDIQLTAGDHVSSGTISLPADQISTGDAAVSLSTTSGDVVIDAPAASDIIFKRAAGTEFLTFNTSDIADVSNVPVTEILGKDDQRLRFRARGAAHDLQLASERNIELCVVKTNDGDTAPVVAIHDATPTAAEETLSGAWEASQNMYAVDLTQLADQTAPAAQFRGSTSGSKLVLNYSTDGSGNPTFATAIPHGGTAYRNKVTISGASYNNGSAIAHTANDNLAQYMSVKGTGIPTGAYIGSITDNENFVIHFEGSTVNTTGGSLSGQVLYARERVVFQDGGNQSTYAIIEIEEAAAGNIYIGNSTAATQAGGTIQNMNGVITTDINKVESGMGIFATAGDLKLGSYGTTNISLTTEFDTIWLSNDSTDHGLPGYTNVQLGTRAFVGNAACSQNRMRFDGDDDNRVIQITANDVSTTDGLDSAAWATGAGFKINVGKSTGVTELSATGAGGTAGNMTIFPEGTLVLKQTTAAADISIQARRTLELIPGVGTQTGAVSIDKNSTITATGTAKALHIDYDHTGISASGQIVTGIGLDLDMNCESVTHVGTVNQTGIDLDMVGATDGAQTNVGMDIKCTGADINQGLAITVPDAALDYHIKLMAADDVNDTAIIKVADTGDLTILTAGSGTTDSDIILDADGVLKLDAASILGGNGIQFLLNGTLVGDITGHHSATNFVLYENVGASVNDFFQLSAYANGATTFKTQDSAGADGHLQFSIDGHVIFDDCPVGFTKIAETFSDDSVIGSGGTDDTHIDFRASNKVSLAVTGNITNLNLIFPAVSGNFLLLLTYDGDHTITNYKVYEADESAADGDADVFWPGGTKPDNTASGVDILSFFYDATASSDKCYGVASLAFATP